jgi:pimeloyl-ACP methyl ester carboxylesterase
VASRNLHRRSLGVGSAGLICCLVLAAGCSARGTSLLCQQQTCNFRSSWDDAAHCESVALPRPPKDQDGLFFQEPYQPGKVPVVFVHGLMAEPTDWYGMAAELRSQPWFNEHFQVWFFQYPTGQPFLAYAASLRAQTRLAVDKLDPAGTDEALRNMVLVGHSLGGLLCKLQAVDSEDRIWNSFASVPLAAIQADEPVKCRLAELCYFEPQPFVGRVILMATPHRGDSWGSRTVGQLVATAKHGNRMPDTVHRQLIADNPGVFSPVFARRMPTSLDLVEPDDPTLQAILSLPVSPCVKVHSIIGTGRPTILEGPGDGVIPVDSARIDGVASERFVDARHKQLQQNGEVNAEVRRILWEHLIAENPRRARAPAQIGPAAVR